MDDLKELAAMEEEEPFSALVGQTLARLDHGPALEQSALALPHIKELLASIF